MLLRNDFWIKCIKAFVVNWQKVGVKRKGLKKMFYIGLKFEQKTITQEGGLILVLRKF